jgi:hypothetical protein
MTDVIPSRNGRGSKAGLARRKGRENDSLQGEQPVWTDEMLHPGVKSRHP